MVDTEERYKHEDWLRTQYWENELSMVEMAEKAGVCRRTINVWIEKHDIPTRSRADGIRLAKGPDETPYRNEEWLRREYVDKKQSAADIAGEVGVTKVTILSWLNKHGIEIRSYPEYL